MDMPPLKANQLLSIPESRRPLLLGVDVDLVMKGALANPYLAREIEQSRQLLYAA